LVVTAASQSAGRGRRGREWSSPEGNLYMSLLVRPECSVADAGQISFVTVVALGEALRRLYEPMRQDSQNAIEFSYKWPNDMLANGRKMSGILLESESDGEGGLSWLVIGVGVNINSHPAQTPFPATDLTTEGCTGLSAADVLSAFCQSLADWYKRWQQEGFAPVRQAWLDHAQGLGREVVVRLPDREITGLFRALNDDGVMILEMPDGSDQHIAAGDVFFSGPDNAPGERFR